MLITAAIIAIAAAMALPLLAVSDFHYVDAGASLMVSDFDFAQTTAISQPSEKALVRFDPLASRWWVAPESAPDTPYTAEYTNEPYDTTMGVGRAEVALDVTFTLVNVTNNTITYDAFGALDQDLSPQIVLARNSATRTITVDADLGFLSVE